MKLFGALIIALAMAMGGAAIAAGMGSMTPATRPAANTSQPATPACCGDACRNMGSGCCKTAAMGKTTCSMGGSCCLKPDTKPAGGMGGMNMGK